MERIIPFYLQKINIQKEERDDREIGSFHGMTLLFI